MTIEFAHKGQGWTATLETLADAPFARLTVCVDCYDDDPCAGSNIVRSAFFRACEILSMDPADSQENHSGGCYSRIVMPEAELQDDDE